MCFTKRAQCSAITSNYDIGIFKEPIDKGHEFDVLLKDLSKTFDFIDHKLLIARLYSYGISPSSFNLVSFYLNNQTQRIKINDCFSLRHEIKFGLPVMPMLQHLTYVTVQGTLLLCFLHYNLPQGNALIRLKNNILSKCWKMSPLIKFKIFNRYNDRRCLK